MSLQHCAITYSIILRPPVLALSWGPLAAVTLSEEVGKEAGTEGCGELEAVIASETMLGSESVMRCWVLQQQTEATGHMPAQ